MLKKVKREYQALLYNDSRLPVNDKKKRNPLGRLVRIVAVLSLVIAYCYGNQQNQNETERKIQETLTGKMVTKIENEPDVYEIADLDAGGTKGWLIIVRQQGWGGPLDAGLYINNKATIESVHILKHRETPAFFNALVDQRYFEQYAGKSLRDNFQLKKDIDGVSGATISSRAISESVRKGAHFWGRHHFGFSIEKKFAHFRVGSNEFILIVLYTLIILSAIKKYRKLRYAIMIFSIFFLGFYLSTPISVSAFGALLMGYMPHLSDNLFWWLLVFGTIVMTLIMGKNLYCAWVCPFGGMQELINKIGGIKVQVRSGINRAAKWIISFFFWLSFMIMFLTNNPANGMFEPFAVLFSLKGFGVQWYLVSVAIIGSFIIPRFWCRFFCPVGLILRTLAKTKKQIVERVQLKRVSLLPTEKVQHEKTIFN